MAARNRLRGIEQARPGSHMVHIRKIYVQGRPCHYLVQRRSGRVLFCLGEHSSIKKAIEYWLAREEAAKEETGREYASSVVLTLSQYLSMGHR